MQGEESSLTQGDNLMLEEMGFVKSFTHSTPQLAGLQASGIHAQDAWAATHKGRPAGD